MKVKKEYTYFIFAALISFVLSTFECLPILISYLNGGNYPVKVNFFDIGSLASLFIWYILSFLSVLVTFVVVYVVLRPYSGFSRKRSGAVKALIISTAVVLGLTILSYLFTDIDQSRILYFSLPRSIIISSVATIYSYFIWLNNKNQKIQLEIEILKKENIKSQYEALKNDLSPHFLFNSLSALQTLIREKPEVANEYVSHLSILLRYALQRNEDNFISLTEEMNLTQSFLFLLKMRYGTNLIVESNIHHEEDNWKILPFTIQPLIENAVKHNEISEQNPLKIIIDFGSSGLLIVSNNIQEKITRESSLGFGLINLSRRYQLINSKEIKVSRENNIFQVTVPLIKNGNEGSDH